jgi:hypothetical protein
MARDNTPWADLLRPAATPSGWVAVFRIVEGYCWIHPISMLIMNLSMACEELHAVFIKCVRSEKMLYSKNHIGVRHKIDAGKIGRPQLLRIPSC